MITIKAITFNITPIGKPRMTQRDRWKQRACVMRYYAYKDQLRLSAQIVGYQLTDELSVRFHVPMPSSWSLKKRARLDGQPCQNKPDLDNMVKALLDALGEEDKQIWRITAEKVWAGAGAIEIIS